MPRSLLLVIFRILSLKYLDMYCRGRGELVQRKFHHWQNPAFLGSWLSILGRRRKLTCSVQCNLKLQQRPQRTGMVLKIFGVGRRRFAPFFGFGTPPQLCLARFSHSIPSLPFFKPRKGCRSTGLCSASAFAERTAVKPV
jgi:hypothetical protein